MRSAGELAQLDADDVARMPPVRLDRYRVRKRVHPVEDHEIGIAEEIGETLRLVRLERVLGIGGINHRPAVLLEAISIGVAAMALAQCRHRHPVDVVAGTGLEMHELYLRLEE